MSFKNLLIFLIIAFAIFVRFLNFTERVTFGSEQARSLIVSGRYIKEKPSLLGQEYFRVTSSGHKLFSGALFSYSLVPLQLILNYQPIPITAFFVVLNIITGLLLFLLARKVFNFSIAVFTLIIFLFSGYMIYHSLFIWILNYLPLIGLLAFYALYLFYKKPKLIYALILGGLSGVGINLQYLFIPFAFLLLLFVIWKSKHKIKSVLLFVVGAIFGNLPMVLFDLRHDFYHLRSLWQYFVDTLANSGQSSITYYHFLHFWPVFALLGGLLLFYIWKRNKPVTVFLMILYLYMNLSSSLVSFKEPTGMPEGLNTIEVINAAEAISQDEPEKFNVVSLLDFDARGHILRYPLEYLYGVKPMGVEEYKEAQSLYVISEKSYDFDRAGVWEINVFEPKEVEILSEIDEDYAVYKLTK